jgi:hypothetical protein
MRLSDFDLHGTALVQTLEAEMQRITNPPGGDVTELDPDTQDLLLSYSKAATEPKSYYRQVQKSSPGLPPYGGSHLGTIELSGRGKPQLTAPAPGTARLHGTIVAVQ